MFSKDLETQEMLARVVQFGRKHSKLFPKDDLTGSTFATIGEELSKIAEHAAAEDAARAAGRTAGTVRTAAREALRTQLARIVQTAAAISIDAPELAAKFRMPDPLKDLNLIYTGQSFLEEAEPFKKKFIDHRLPHDFIDKLKIAVQDLQTAILDQADRREDRANAAKEIRETMKRCLTLLQRIDAVVVNTLSDKPAIKAELEVTRRVIRKAAVRPRKSIQEKPPQVPAPAETAAATTTA
jgi:hypothetical protein